MKIKVLKETPRNIKEFPVENEYNLSKEEVTDIAEIFSTPLTGSYNWDYTVQDNRIKRLYELGNEHLKIDTLFSTSLFLGIFNHFVKCL